MKDTLLAICVILALAMLTLSPNQMRAWMPYVALGLLAAVLLLFCAYIHEWEHQADHEQDEHSDNSVG